MTEPGAVDFYIRKLDVAVTFCTQIVGPGLVGRIFGGHAVMLPRGAHITYMELYADKLAVDRHQQHDWTQAPVKPLRL